MTRFLKDHMSKIAEVYVGSGGTAAVSGSNTLLGATGGTSGVGISSSLSMGGGLGTQGSSTTPSQSSPHHGKCSFFFFCISMSHDLKIFVFTHQKSSN